MPFTFLAHQTVVLPLKIKRPRWFDATALCLGSMAPDIAYGVHPWLSERSHGWIGLFVWSIPFSLVACIVVRRWVAPTAFAQFPDCGELRLHSFRALRHRRPNRWVTLSSAVIGGASHVVLDGFTHNDRIIADWLGLDRFLFNMPARGPMTIARTLQYFGHTVGSAIGVMMLAVVGGRMLMEEWYGADVVAADRRFLLPRSRRVAFWALVAAGPPIGLLWAAAQGSATPFRVIDATALTTVIACVLPGCQPIDVPAGRSADPSLDQPAPRIGQ